MATPEPKVRINANALYTAPNDLLEAQALKDSVCTLYADPEKGEEFDSWNRIRFRYTARSDVKGGFKNISRGGLWSWNGLYFDFYEDNIYLVGRIIDPSVKGEIQLVGNCKLKETDDGIYHLDSKYFEIEVVGTQSAVPTVLSQWELHDHGQHPDSYAKLHDWDSTLSSIATNRSDIAELKKITQAHKTSLAGILSREETRNA